MQPRVFVFVFLALASAACHRTAPAAPPAAPTTRPAPTATAPPAAAPIVQPGAPGSAARVVTSGKAADLSRVGFTAADVQFMQGMIGHHAQAVEMVALLDQNSSDPDMKKLGLRISVSQADEIGMMKKWLQARGQEVPMEHMHHDGHDMGLMPGMLTTAEMATLASAKGREFDRLFLEGMIKHHGGALTMVKDLLATSGAAQESEMFAFASDVDSDQRMEIERMAAMLKERQK
ncbi:MAG: DUF305 domain-containing protein [Vicinamibacterales bacterium]